MSLKLAALAVLLAVFGAVLAVSRPVAAPAPLLDGIAPAVAMLPATQGGYRLVRRISTALDDGFSEDSADYVADSALAVQLWVLTAPRAHNGIGCHVRRGEALQQETLRTVDTAGAKATFDVALFKDGGKLNLVANTECFGDACTESLIRDWSAQWHRVDLSSPFLPQQPAVPVTVILSDAVGPDGAAAAQSRLLAGFEHFAAGLDLAPMREYAARH